MLWIIGLHNIKTSSKALALELVFVVKLGGNQPFTR